MCYHTITIVTSILYHTVPRAVYNINRTILTRRSQAMLPSSSHHARASSVYMILCSTGYTPAGIHTLRMSYTHAFSGCTSTTTPTAHTHTSSIVPACREAQEHNYTFVLYA